MSHGVTDEEAAAAKSDKGAEGGQGQAKVTADQHPGAKVKLRSRPQQQGSAQASRLSEDELEACMRYVTLTHTQQFVLLLKCT